MNAQDQVLKTFLQKHSWLSDWYIFVCWRYCNAYIKKYQTPVGRPIAKFMLWFNRKHGNTESAFFSNEEINFYYYY